GARPLVGLFAYMCSDPERYDICVFKYPLSRLVNYVKRAVGLPNERIVIFHGQIYAAPDQGKVVKITRKPGGLQETISRQTPVIPAEDTVELDSGKWFRHWEPVA